MGFVVSFHTLSGLPLSVSLGRAFVKGHKAAQNELLVGVQQILQDSQMLVLVDSGALKSSGEVIEQDQGDTVIINYGDDTIGAGGLPSRMYALDQHENLSYNHPHGGQAKFLEEPFLNRLDEVRLEVFKAFARALNGTP